MSSFPPGCDPALQKRVRMETSTLLSQQLLRQDGVAGLFGAVLGEGDEIEEQGTIYLQLCRPSLSDCQ